MNHVIIEILPANKISESIATFSVYPSIHQKTVFRGKLMRIKIFAIAMVAVTAPIAQLSAQQALIVGPTGTPVLRIGTEVPVRIRTELTTNHKALRVGQRFEVEATEPVSLDGHLVIPVGTPGVGEISSVRNKGMWGKSGHFDIRLLYLRVGDRQIRLSGTLDDKGTAGGIGATAVSAIVFLPAGFFMTGTSARMPAGTIVKGYLDEDVPVIFPEAAKPTPIAAQPTPPAVSSPTVIPPKQR